jgi:hypothetical protein
MGRLDDEAGGTAAGVAKEPTRKLLAEWIVGSYENVSEEMGVMLGRRRVLSRWWVKRIINFGVIKMQLK